MKNRRYLIAILISTIIVFSLANGSLLYLALPGPLEKPTDIIIEKGSSTRLIATKLSEAKIIRYPALFNIISKAYSLFGRHLKSGEYEILAGSTPFQVFQVLSSGKSIIHKIVVVEGSQVHETVTALKNQKVLTGDIEENEVTEGFLMPSTYFFSYGDSRKKILSQMKSGVSATLGELMPQLSPDSPLKTRLDVLILASIVEKEAYLEGEKPLIAAVFINRLKKGMKLQADPTTIYGVTMRKYILSRPLSKIDLRSDNIYNTYYIKGMPPTPIANPSRSSIEAVIKPAKTKDLYFVVNGSGGHNFSSDLAAHEANIANYRKSRAKVN